MKTPSAEQRAYALGFRQGIAFQKARSGGDVSDDTMPDLRPEFQSRVEVGSGVAALFCDTGTPDEGIAIEHQCTRPRDGQTLLIAPFLTRGPGGHRVASVNPLTISPSILCGDCGLHGFITNGRWNGA